MTSLIRLGVTILQQGDMMQLTYYQWPRGRSEQRVLPGTTRISSMDHRRNHKPTLHCQERQDTRGTTNDQSAYCSELFGLWGMLRMIQNFTKARQIKTGKITITCDGLLALQQAKSSHPTNLAAVHYGLIGAIHQLHRKLPIEVVFEHVKGHQDTRCTTALPQLVWMNIEMDALAKATIDLQAQGPTRYKLEEEQWICYIAGWQQVKQVTTALQEHINQ